MVMEMTTDDVNVMKTDELGHRIIIFVHGQLSNLAELNQYQCFSSIQLDSCIVSTS
jgi:hypothetical protein